VDGMPVLYRCYHGYIAALKYQQPLAEELDVVGCSAQITEMFFDKIKEFVHGMEPTHGVIVLDGFMSKESRQNTIQRAKAQAQLLLDELQELNRKPTDAFKQIELLSNDPDILNLVSLANKWKIRSTLQQQQKHSGLTIEQYDIISMHADKLTMVAKWLVFFSSIKRRYKRGTEELKQDILNLNLDLDQVQHKLEAVRRLIGDVSLEYSSVQDQLSLVTQFPEYKGQRKKMPKAIALSLSQINKEFPKQGIKSLQINGVEADDVIGTLATVATKEDQGVHAYVVSIDKDLLQLVGPRITVCKPESGGYKKMLKKPIRQGLRINAKICDMNWFSNEYQGLNPSQYIDILALMGDAADNIPGVKGLGPKRSLKLIKEYGSIENVIKNHATLSGMPSTLRHNISLQSGETVVAKQLVQLDCDVKLPQNWHQFEL